jgi:formate C-acetyltransferase
MGSAWDGFKQGKWAREINVRDFIQENFTPYTGDNAFLASTILRSSLP